MIYPNVWRFMNHHIRYNINIKRYIVLYVPLESWPIWYYMQKTPGKHIFGGHLSRYEVTPHHPPQPRRTRIYREQVSTVEMIFRERFDHLMAVECNDCCENSKKIWYTFCSDLPCLISLSCLNLSSVGFKSFYWVFRQDILQYYHFRR